MTTVHASPEYQMQIGRPAPEGYPALATPDAYVAHPTGQAFAQRRAAFLEHWLHNPAPNNTKSAYFELARMAAGGQPHPGILYAALAYIDARRDCADFVLHAILRLLYWERGLGIGDWAGEGDPRALIPPGYAEDARETVLGFKYWPDEPGIDDLCTWTENHTILYASAAYLAGQLYPDAVFANSGQSGRQKMALNRPRILRWLGLRFRTGFSEWLSHVYYDEDLTALLSLVDFAADAEIRERATMVLDLLLLDMALNSFRGVFGSSHGRSYENSKKWAANEGTVDTQKLLFGMGQYSGFDNMSAVAFALSPRYRVPPAIVAIAQDLERPALANRQRMGIRLEEAERWGLAFDNYEDGMQLLTLEAYAHPRTAALTLQMFDAFDWWENAFFEPFRQYRPLLKFLNRSGLLQPATRFLEWDLCRNTREEVNVYTYRTPDYMLSTAQDYRPGYGGDQQQIWQATLGPDAVCFTTHPAKVEGSSPNYWTGSGVLPRAAQVENVVIVVYHIHSRPALYVPNRLFFTHAWLPRDRFDEVVAQGGWVFARRGDGYLALCSQQPAVWQGAPGEDQGRELIAPGADNIWICELGRRADDGPFARFVERIAAAPLTFADRHVVYHSPSQGVLSFGWQGLLRRDGDIVPLHDYPRYDNPYAAVPFPAEAVTVRAAGHALSLEWSSGARRVEDSG